MITILRERLNTSRLSSSPNGMSPRDAEYLCARKPRTRVRGLRTPFMANTAGEG